MANWYQDNEDLRFYVEKAIDWPPLVEAVERGFRAHGCEFRSADEAVAFYREILDQVGEFVANEMGPHIAEVDRAELRLVDGEVALPPRVETIFRKINSMGLHGLCLPRELGGLNAPLLVYMLTTEIIGRADVSLMAHHGFHGGMAMAMLIFSVMEGTTEYSVTENRIVSTRFEKEIAEITAGRAWGCMDITEPDAGSDMAALRTRGEQDADGNWTVTGQKIFITSGHGKYHFVIARTEAPSGNADDPMAGLHGLSLFLVPTYTDEGGKRRRLATVDRIEEKLGHHASVTAAISFDKTPAHLIGKRGEGFQGMLLLMNNARIGVGLEALGICEQAWRLATAYAAERRSMGKAIAHHEMIADYLDEMRTDIQGIRALAYSACFNEEISARIRTELRFGAAGDDASRSRREREQRMYAARARRVTPLLKYLATEKAVEMARRCLQIHGGSGYTTEYGAEKLLRDALVMPIYEGTSQIQSLMAMKDSLGAAMKNPKEFMRRSADAMWKSVSAPDPLQRSVGRVVSLGMQAQQYLIARTASDKLRAATRKPISTWRRTLTRDWNPKRDFAYAMLHAERLTRLLADGAVVEALWEQATRFPERREVLERYLERAEPRARFLHDEITKTGDGLLRRLAAATAGPTED